MGIITPPPFLSPQRSLPPPDPRPSLAPSTSFPSCPSRMSVFPGRSTPIVTMSSPDYGNSCSSSSRCDIPPPDLQLSNPFLGEISSIPFLFPPSMIIRRHLFPREIHAPPFSPLHTLQKARSRPFLSFSTKNSDPVPPLRKTRNTPFFHVDLHTEFVPFQPYSILRQFLLQTRIRSLFLLPSFFPLRAAGSLSLLPPLPPWRQKQLTFALDKTTALFFFLPLFSSGFTVRTLSFRG